MKKLSWQSERKPIRESADSGVRFHYMKLKIDLQ